MKSLATVSLLAVLALAPAAHAAEESLNHTLVLTVESPADDQRLDRIMRAVAALERVEGVSEVKVDLAQSQIYAKFPASSSDPQKILGSLERSGFHALFEEEVRIATGRSRETAELMTVSAN